MKLVKNNSRQSIVAYFQTDQGASERTLKPGESIVVPASFITRQIETLQRRRLFKITNY